jgi:hypothetical protein
MIHQLFALLYICVPALAATSHNHPPQHDLISSNDTSPIILSMTSAYCIQVPNSTIELVNCTTSDDDQSLVSVVITARNIFNQSFSIQSSDYDYFDPLLPAWGEEDDWTWNYTGATDSSDVTIYLNVSTYPAYILLVDHNASSVYQNVTLTMNWCDFNLQLYYINYPNGLDNIVQCQSCAVGSVLDQDDQTVCDPCVPETFWIGGQCEQCPPNQFQPNSSATACYTCDQRPDLEECQIGNIPLAIAVIAALASPLITLAVVMCVIRQRAMGRCRCNRKSQDFDEIEEGFLQEEDYH